MDEEGRTYSQRVFTMHNGLVMPVRLDDWYWYHFDTLIAAAPDGVAPALEEEICKTCYEISKSFGPKNGLDPLAAFRHTLGYWIQENVKAYGLDPAFQSA